MKAKIALVLFMFLGAYVISSCFVIGNMNETQMWTLLFFDIVAFLQMLFLATIFLNPKEG